MSIAGLLWVLLAIVLVIWLFGLLVAHAGGLINLLLILALIILVYNLFVGRPVA